MDRAIEAARQGDTPEGFVSGVMLVRTQLFRILQEEGLERVSVLGLPFDADASEVVERRPVTDRAQDGMIIEELQGGHRLGGHVVRRSKVVVAEYREPAADVAPAPEVEAIPAAVLADAPSADPEDEPIEVESAEPELDPRATMALDMRPMVHLLLPAPLVARTSAEPADDAVAAHEPPPDLRETQFIPRSSIATVVHGAAIPAATPEPSEPLPTPEPELAPPEAAATIPAAVSAAVPHAADSTPPQRRTDPGLRTDPGVRTLPLGTVAPPLSRRGRGPGFYAALSVILVLAAALGFELRVLRSRARMAEPPRAEPTAATATAPVATHATVPIPEEVTIVSPPAAEAATADGSAAPSAAAGPAAAPVSVPASTAAADSAATRAGDRTSPAPRTARSAHTPTPAAVPANPVPGLLLQAEQAEASHRFDEAITRYDEVLKLEPGHADASARRLRAMGERASVGRYFLTAVTMSEGKASGGGIKGFDGGQVVKSECECALTYEVSPPDPVQGQPYAVTIRFRNDSRKDIKPQSLAVTVTVNGASSHPPVVLAAKPVAKGQATTVGRLEDVWRVGTTSWSLEAAVGAGGNTYRAQLTWELRMPAR